MMDWNDVSLPDISIEPMRGQPEMTPPVPRPQGLSLRYIARLEARVAELEPLVNALHRAVQDALSERDHAKARVAELQSELRRLAHADATADRDDGVVAVPDPGLVLGGQMFSLATLLANDGE